MEHPDLIKACKQNNPQAQMKVYHLYKDMLYNVSLRIVKDQQDAQDIVHDTFIKAFQNISKSDNNLKLGGWLKRIAINCSLDLLKKKKKINWLQESMENQQIEEETTEIDERSLKVEEVKQAINNLKDKYRIILAMYLIEDYTHKEIAEQLGLNESTVRNQYARGKRLLKKQLKNKLAI